MTADPWGCSLQGCAVVTPVAIPADPKLPWVAGHQKGLGMAVLLQLVDAEVGSTWGGKWEVPSRWSVRGSKHRVAGP